MIHFLHIGVRFRNSSFPLPHYCGISRKCCLSSPNDLSWSVILQHNNATPHSTQWTQIVGLVSLGPSILFLGLLKQHLGDHPLHNNNEVEMAFCECKNLTATTEFLKSGQDKTNASMCSAIMIKIMILQWKQVTYNRIMTSNLIIDQYNSEKTVFHHAILPLQIHEFHCDHMLVSILYHVIRSCCQLWLSSISNKYRKLAEWYSVEKTKYQEKNLS
jgi:hypothetical protein